MRIGNMFDAFVELRRIAESSGREQEIRQWAREIALFMGEWENLREAWPEVATEAES